jgi:hypothetical protein
MSSSADRLYEIVRDLPEDKLAEIIDFAEFLKAKTAAEKPDFFAFAGLWDEREISQESLRKQAWRQEPK